LRPQSLETASISSGSSSPTRHSVSPTQRSVREDSTTSWKSSIRRIVSVLNLVPKEKSSFEKQQERKLREVDMYMNRPQICRLPLKSLTS
uniref:KID domain-containing protein n=1 Tax=Haemonchus placei TaxID=6290 RepID=A0A0N4X6Q1_HAEPC